MRIGSVSLLVLAAFALAACSGAETGGSTLAASSINGLDIEPCTLDTCPPNPDGDNGNDDDDNDDDDDDDDDGLPPNTGNTTDLNPATTDVTVALESAVLVSPDEGSRSILTQTAGSPNTARLQIDTRTNNNGNWPIPKTMNEYVYGTNATGGVGLGGTYNEYRVLTADEGGALVNEVLQVWNWGNSYGTQYRDEVGDGAARRQAWSFGGNRTAAMPVGGNANYTGAYGATAETWNWVDNQNPLRVISANNSWRVEGTSNINVDFGTGQFDGALTPVTWTARREGDRIFQSVNSANPADPNWVYFMGSDVVLEGTITGNTVTGTASLDPAQGWLNGTNPMHAGFFGAGASEVTGVYNFVAASPEPVGGQPPINDPAVGFVQQSGIFNAQ